MKILAYIFTGVCVAVVISAAYSFPISVTYVQAPTVTPDEKPVSKPDNRILFVGDIMLGRNVEKLMAQYGSKYPFVRIKDFLNGYPSVIANLEGPIMQNHIPTPAFSTRFSFSSTTPIVLREHNIFTVSLANNHTYDYGSDKYDETKKFLEEDGIEYMGHPFDSGTEYSLYKNNNDTKYIFISYNMTNPHFNFDKALNVVRDERASSTDAWIVVMPHWGDEYILTSNNTQKEFAHSLIESGASLVVGHHPHVTQEIEYYKGRLIFFSLGNFVFDQYFSKDVEEGLAVALDMKPEYAEFQLFPIKSSRSQPGLMGEGRDEWLKELAIRSSRELTREIENGSIRIPYK